VTAPVTSAPGKLFLSGEWAVLEGAEAVVTAVSRRAVAHPMDGPAPPPSPVLDAVLRRAEISLTSERESLGSFPALRVDSGGFSFRGRKLGLGSSAAVCAAACGLLYEWAGLPIRENRGALLEDALAAHLDAQGGRGSGADVATAVTGGTIVFSTGGRPEPIEIRGITLVFAWTGRVASTSLLIDAVTRPASAPSRDRAMDDLSALARGLADAYRRGDALAAVEGTARYGEAMEVLGRATSCPIVTPEHEEIRRIAETCGGAAKPSGAGGGDAAVAAFADEDGAAEFERRCTASGFEILDLEIGAAGLRREEPGGAVCESGSVVRGSAP